jgi:hypothetical protein
MVLVVLPYCHHNATSDLLKKPLSTVAITLRDTLTMRLPPVGMVPLKQTVVQPLARAFVIHKNLQNLRETAILFPAPTLARHLASASRGLVGAHRAPLSSKKFGSMLMRMHQPIIAET